MRVDHYAYSRATKVAGIGLLLQLVMGTVLLVFGIIAPQEAAVAARNQSAQRERRLAGARLFGTTDPAIGDELGDRRAPLAALEEAPLAGKIAAYAQGFEVMAQASATWNWRLPFRGLARI